MKHVETLTKQTIDDFGEQWVNYRENSGYYASPELFADLVEPLLSASDFQGKTVADIGSGTGRIVNMLLGAGAARVVAVEPSEAFDVLQENTREMAEKIEYIRGPGEEVKGPVDLVVSFGVIHHIPDPMPTLHACYQALQPGGKILIWIYGREGNGLYLALARPLRFITQRMPHKLLVALCRALDLPLKLYILLCRALPLPMKGYCLNHLANLSPEVRRLTIYDQLNPAWAKYYREAEAKRLLEDSGFRDVKTHHRHGYSWTVLGTKESG